MNLGDEAILESITAELRRRLPVEIVVFSLVPEDTVGRHDVDRVLPVRKLSRAESAEEVERLDLFVLGGGGLLYDRDARHYLREVRIAGELGIPVMTWAISAGPLENREDQLAARRALNRADAITVRDERDRCLLQEVGVGRDVSVTADPAFLMKPEPFTPEMLKGEGIDPGTRLIALSVREPGPAAPHFERGHYHALLTDAADFLVDRMEATVVFVPMERHNSDLQRSHGVVSRMAAPHKAWILRGEYAPRQVLGFMSHVEFAVGMRLHFLIFAALAGVPFVPLPYASKVEGLVDELLYSHCRSRISRWVHCWPTSTAPGTGETNCAPASGSTCPPWSSAPARPSTRPLLSSVYMRNRRRCPAMSCNMQIRSAAKRRANSLHVRGPFAPEEDGPLCS